MEPAVSQPEPPMAKSWISSSSLVLLLSLAMVTLHLADATVPAIFILGDSTADVGTNNYLPESTARADFPFNGIDFPFSRPTGRFSNGFNSADYLGMYNWQGYSKLMGQRRSPPPFLSLQNKTSRLMKHIVRGVNFASGGSGLLDTTGLSLGRVIPLGEQIQQFATVRNNLTAVMGPAATESLLSKSVFLISIGSNDIFNYYSSNGNSNKEEFLIALKSKYEDHLKNLFNLGARKFGIISVPPIGCCPSLRALNPTGGCVEDLNDYARAFFSTTEALFSKLSSEFKGMTYSLGNAYEMTMNVIENPLPFGLKELKTACCGAGKFNGESPCVPTANICSNRDEYLFWDLYHPTQAVAELAALTLYGGALRFVTPFNFSQLAEVN
ncbi:hypothetical protein HHK36_010395 [Tetracentron sinense]|uniref:Uncharacterized protein n=1 Tax=Tetracentron sinense TaxID=13715 RepID=A0A834ZHZ4_TETSI|nr:hypothetical protein HHK36_010395 [Tetracentron sinense]